MMKRFAYFKLRDIPADFLPNILIEKNHGVKPERFLLNKI